MFASTPPGSSHESQNHADRSHRRNAAGDATTQPGAGNPPRLVNADVAAIPDGHVYVDGGARILVRCEALISAPDHENLDYAPFVACRVYPAFENTEGTLLQRTVRRTAFWCKQPCARRPNGGASRTLIQNMPRGRSWGCGFVKPTGSTPVLPARMDIASAATLPHLEAVQVSVHSNGQKTGSPQVKRGVEANRMVWPGQRR